MTDTPRTDALVKELSVAHYDESKSARASRVEYPLMELCRELERTLAQLQVDLKSVADLAIQHEDALQDAQKEIERLTGERWAFEDAVSQAIGSPRFMDPPDGGDVSLPEQVDRMRQALEAAEDRIAQLEADKKVLHDTLTAERREREELRRALADREPMQMDADVRRARAALNQEGQG